MNLRRILILAPAFFLLSYLPAFSQRDSVPLTTILSKVNTVAEEYPIEKVYLHFDKPYYAIGDTIQLKAYITQGLHQPSILSKVVYVDVISSRDSLVVSLMLPAKDGMAVGSIPLSLPQFKQDNYHVKAYTRWMSNFDVAYFFHKTVPVGNAIGKMVSSTVEFKRGISNQTTQITSTITYKDPDGNPYANKKVTWELTAANVEVAKGKENTDAKGQIRIVFLNTRSVDLSTAVLITSVEGEKGRSYTIPYSLKPVAAAVDFQFFPEGGNMVTGLTSRVAVKATRPNGLGADFSASVTDNTGAVITTFNSKHAGMSAFDLTPEAGKTYKATVDFKDGTKADYDLPRVQQSGFLLSVSHPDTSRVAVKLTADPAFIRSHLNEAFYVVARRGQAIYYAAQMRLSSANYQAFVPTAKFPTGVIQFTLFNAFGQPLSERIVFVMHRDQLDLAASTDKPQYGRRQKVALTLSSKTNTAPLASGFSVSVTDETKVPVVENNEMTIVTNLLLTSELKGYIESPNYYFSRVSEKAAADLDLLMLTQGYRRYTYPDILGNKIPITPYLPEQGISLTGTLRTLDGMPFKGGSVSLQIPDKFFTARAVSDGGGRFRFNNLAFIDSTKVIISARNNYNAKNLMIMMDGSTFPAPGKNPYYQDEMTNIDTMMTAYLENSKKIMNNSTVLKEVVLTAKAPVKPAGPTHSDYPALGGLSSINAQTIDGERLKGCTDVLSCIRGLAFGTTFDNEQFYVSRDYNAGSRIPMAIFLRGAPVDVRDLSFLNAAEIASIEVFLKDELGLVNSAYQTNGVLVVNMKELSRPKGGQKISLQDLQDMLPQPNNLKLAPKGYNFAKEFYSPKYLPATNTFGADLRTTLYWNPRVTLDATGKALLEFYTADSKGSYRVVAEGLDQNGRIGRVVYHFKVE